MDKKVVMQVSIIAHNDERDNPEIFNFIQKHAQAGNPLVLMIGVRRGEEFLPAIDVVLDVKDGDLPNRYITAYFVTGGLTCVPEMLEGEKPGRLWIPLDDDWHPIGYAWHNGDGSLDDLVTDEDKLIID